MNLYTHPLAKAFLSKVYAWMAVAMLVTAGVAIYSAKTPKLLFMALENWGWIFLSAIVIIVCMSLFARRLPQSVLAVMLLAFAGIQGLLFGPILIAFTQASLATTFACTAGAFGSMSLYGALTKRDLGPWGRALSMVLFGLIICVVVNFFTKSSNVDLIISAVGVVLFSLYTAYDTQKILQEGLELEGEERSKGAIFGALTLYLDFINLFLYLLRFLGEVARDSSN